jgi:hypothetical protein
MVFESMECFIVHDTVLDRGKGYRLAVYHRGWDRGGGDIDPQGLCVETMNHYLPRYNPITEYHLLYLHDTWLNHWTAKGEK